MNFIKSLFHLAFFFYSITPSLFQVPILEIMSRIKKGKNLKKKVFQRLRDALLKLVCLVRKNRKCEGSPEFNFGEEKFSKIKSKFLSIISTFSTVTKFK